MIASFPVLFYLVFKCVSDTNYFAEEGVIPPQNTEMKHKSTGLGTEIVGQEYEKPTASTIEWFNRN